MNNNTKKELKVVFSPELHDELRFTFRPEVLENIIYLPETLGEKKWQCCCGSVSELDVCPICGMDKNTVFSKVNAGYLARHRKARIARKKKAVQDQQAMMAAQMLKKTRKQKKEDKSTSKLGILVGVILLCAAIIISVAIIFGGDGDGNKPVDTTINPISTNAPDTKAPEESETNTPETEPVTEPETTIPETTAPIVPVEVPIAPADGHVATIGDGKWPAGASGNVSAGGQVYASEEYDYIALNGITVLDRAGNTVSVLTENKALAITGSGNYIFYIDESYSVHRIDTTTKDDVAFPFKAKMICTYFDELYYAPNDVPGLYASNFYGDITKIVSTTLNVYAMNCTAEKLYFSTDESLAVISSSDGKVTTFCPDGAKATSIIEITECVFYTGTDGKLKFFNPIISNSFGVEYPVYNLAITHVTAFENRVYIRTVDPYSGAVLWYFTRWTPGTRLFAPSAFASTGITTSSLYVSASAVYDGNLYRYAVS